MQYVNNKVEQLANQEDGEINEIKEACPNIQKYSYLCRKNLACLDICCADCIHIPKQQSSSTLSTGIFAVSHFDWIQHANEYSVDE